MLGDYSRLSHYEGDKNHSFENEITVLRLSCYVEHQRHVRNTNSIPYHIYSTGNCISCAVENNVLHPQQPLYKLVMWIYELSIYGNSASSAFAENVCNETL